jgi:hypothetical protein
VFLFTNCLYSAQFFNKERWQDRPNHRATWAIDRLFEDVFADDAIKIEFAADFAANATEGADEEVDFAGEIEGTCSANRKGLDFAIQNRGVVDLFAGEALDIGSDDAFVGRGDLITDGFEDSGDGFVIDQKLVNGGNHIFDRNRREFEQGVI